MHPGGLRGGWEKQHKKGHWELRYTNDVSLMLPEPIQVTEADSTKWKQTYVYGAGGERISVSYLPAYDPNNGWEPSPGSGGAKPGTAAKKLWYLNDALGSVLGLVEKDGRVSARYHYDEFGVVLDAKKFDLNWPGPDNLVGYTGLPYDYNSGLTYARARYYKPEIGRFISEDTYKGQIWNPQSQNLYSYVHNNPLKYIDPSGHCIADWLGKSYCKAAWDKTKEVVSNAWDATTEFVGNIRWGDVGWGLLQAAGGGFEIAGGFTLATGGTAASGGILGGITITAGGVLIVDGASNASGGLSKAWNGLMGNDKGETMNFIKNAFVSASKSNGEQYYNYYQMGMSVMSLSLAARQLATKSGQVTKSATGYFQLQKEGVNIGYTVTDAKITKITIDYMTTNGYRYKTVEINTALIISGITDGTITTVNMSR